MSLHHLNKYNYKIIIYHFVHLSSKIQNTSHGAQLILCICLYWKTAVCIPEQKQIERAYLRLLKFVKVWCDIEEDSIECTR